MGGRSAVFLFVLVFSCLVPPPLRPPLLVVGGGGVRLPRSLRIELEAASFFLPRQEQSSMRMNRTTELSGQLMTRPLRGALVAIGSLAPSSGSR